MYGPQMARGAASKESKSKRGNGQRGHEPEPDEIDPAWQLGVDVRQLEADEEVTTSIHAQGQGDQDNKGQNGDENYVDVSIIHYDMIYDSIGHDLLWMTR